MFERTIWLYWENPPGSTEPPAHVRLCRRIMMRNCGSCRIVLVTPENLNSYLPGLSTRIHEIGVLTNKGTKPSIAIKCAFIRAFLIELYGGVYLDSDCILMKDPGILFDALESSDFVTMRRTSAPRKHISIGFYGSRPGGRIISFYAERLRRMLSDRTHFKWGDAGAWALTPIVDEHQDQCFLFPEERIHPIVAEKQAQFLSNASEIESYLSADPLTFMLFHRLFEREELVDASEEDLLAGDTVLSEAFRRALAEGDRR